MEKTVYLVRDEGDVIREKFEKAGYRILVGNGKFIDSYLNECDALVLGKERITGEVLEKAPNLKIVGKFGVGLDRIDIPACTARGIYVANTPMTNYISVAEHTLMMILASAKKIYPIGLYLRHEYPDYWCRERYQGIEIYGKVLTVIGLGNIGRRVAQLACSIGMEVVGYDPFLKTAEGMDYLTMKPTLEEALSCADFVTLHVAGTEQTRHMISKKQFHEMKKTAILINVSRGFVVNETDLIEALRNQEIAGAALDVFEEEPIAPGNPLMLMENVLATPHCAGNTMDARLRSQKECAEDIIAALEGKRPRFAQNDPVIKD